MNFLSRKGFLDTKSRSGSSRDGTGGIIDHKCITNPCSMRKGTPLGRNNTCVARAVFKYSVYRLGDHKLRKQEI